MSWIEKAKDFIKGHPDQAKNAAEKVEDLINEKTGGKYADHIDKGSDALGEQLGLPPDPEDAPAPTPTEPVPTPAEPAPSPAPTEAAPEPDLPADPGETTGLPRDPVPTDDPGTSDAPTPTEAPAPTPTEAGPTTSDTGTSGSGGALPDLPTGGDLTLDDPPSSAQR